MSLQPQQPPAVPETTARVASAAFPKGNTYMKLRDELGVIYQDERFAPLFPAVGQRAEAPWRLALVTVMQFAENLTDRQAAEAVRARIDWKYALGLELIDTGFDYSVLSEFRSRLIAGVAELELLDALLERLGELGLVKGGGRQRTDSTHVLAAIRTLNRLELVGETLRAALNALAVAAPEWLRAVAPAEWWERYTARLESYRLPKQRAQREALAETIGSDGLRLLSALNQPGAPVWLRQVPAVETLRRVWLQQYYAPQLPPYAGVCLRTSEDQPPSALLIVSPHDPQARYSTKRSTEWVGYKVHVTETCGDEKAVQVITHVQTTVSTTPDLEATSKVHQALSDKGLCPAEHLADGGYVDVGLLVSSRREQGVELVGPMRPDNSWQAKEHTGYDLSRFCIHWEYQVATCPQGQLSRRWAEGCDEHGQPQVQVWFDQAECLRCCCRSLCTRSETLPRTLTLHPRAEHEALQQARQRQDTQEYKQLYAQRAGVEGTLSQGVRAYGLRRGRYIGLAKTHLQHVAMAAAINLARLDDWWSETFKRAQTRMAPFARLAPTATHV